MSAKERYPLHQILYDLWSNLLSRFQRRQFAQPFTNEEIRFTYTNITGLYACSVCGSAVVNTEIHRSAHEAGKVV